MLLCLTLRHIGSECVQSGLASDLPALLFLPVRVQTCCVVRVFSCCLIVQNNVSHTLVLFDKILVAVSQLLSSNCKINDLTLTKSLYHDDRRQRKCTRYLVSTANKLKTQSAGCWKQTPDCAREDRDTHTSEGEILGCRRSRPEQMYRARILRTQSESEGATAECAHLGKF